MLLAVEPYLKESIDENISIKLNNDKKKFSIFLRNKYNFYEMKILDASFLLLEIKDEAPSIDALNKHLKRIKEVTNQEIVFYYKTITGYRRKSLIAHRIPFIIENGQLFLPFLGLLLKKTPQYLYNDLSQGSDIKRKSFSTSAQLAFLYFLYNKETIINTSNFASKFRFTTMTASRALNELYAAKLITYEIGGITARSKMYKRISDPEYVKKGLEYLKTPIKRLVYVKEVPENAFIAGLDALSSLSMMNPPEYKVRAISINSFKDQDINIIESKDVIKDNKFVELEIWDYDPKLFSQTENVDLISLYASLKDEKDERIEQALEYLLRGEIWYKDYKI